MICLNGKPATSRLAVGPEFDETVLLYPLSYSPVAALSTIHVSGETAKRDQDK